MLKLTNFIAIISKFIFIHWKPSIFLLKILLKILKILKIPHICCLGLKNIATLKIAGMQKVSSLSQNHKDLFSTKIHFSLYIYCLFTSCSCSHRIKVKKIEFSHLKMKISLVLILSALHFVVSDNVCYRIDQLLSTEAEIKEYKKLMATKKVLDEIEELRTSKRLHMFKKSKKNSLKNF